MEKFVMERDKLGKTNRGRKAVPLDQDKVSELLKKKRNEPRTLYNLVEASLIEN